MYVWRRDLRREMIWATCVGLPFGFIDYFLVPDYWNPPSLFGLMQRYSVGVESFMFMALMSGISAVSYEFATGKKLVRLSKSKRPPLVLAPFVVALFVFALLTIYFPQGAVYAFMMAGLAGSLLAILFRPDLSKTIILGAFVFSGFYTGIFFLVNLMFPGAVSALYNIPNMLGIFLAGVPIEEILVAFCIGGFWAAAYELFNGYRS